jgi:hypothetical protein
MVTKAISSAADVHSNHLATRCGVVQRAARIDDTMPATAANEAKIGNMFQPKLIALLLLKITLLRLKAT